MRFAAALLIPFALLLASCGGGAEKEDAQSLLDRAFANSVHSADVKLDATIQINGAQSADRAVRIKAGGPFKGGNGRLPSADIDLEIGTGGGGQTVQSGFLSTGDRAFVKFQDVYYEEPASEVRRANRSLARNNGKGRSPKSLGLDPRSWLGRARDKGDERVAGVDTTHISGTLDVKAVIGDLNRFVRRSGSALGGATGQPTPKPLGKDDIAAIARVVKDPSFDVYIGKSDNTIHRLAGRLQATVPQRDQAKVGGVKGGSFEFSIELRNVNGDQKIEAPAKARPLSDLTSSLGTSGLRGLGSGGLGGGGSGNGSAGPEGSTAPPTATTGPDQKAFKAYSDCLEKADPNDTAALQRCAQLLQP